MPFLLECNYWASNTGCEIGNQWDETVVQKDSELLARYGVSCMWVFPNWRDFQPVQALYGSKGKQFEYRMADCSLPENQDYLDPVMLERFNRLCRLAEKNGIRTIRQAAAIARVVQVRYGKPSCSQQRDIQLWANGDCR